MSSTKKDVFKNWEKNATLRTAPLHTIESLGNARFLSSSVSPILNLECITELNQSEIRFVEIQLLYRYLAFTEYLETKLVNPQILEIANDSYGLGFPQIVKINAYKIYCDEAFHVLQAFNMIDQIHQLTQVLPLAFNVDINDRLKQLEKEFHPSVRAYFSLFFVAVSECLVSQELNGYVKDQSIHSEILALMRDHARDEALHAAFFVNILEHLHQKLGPEKFNHFVEMIPKMLEAYLLPNEEDIKLILEQLKTPSVVDKFTSKAVRENYSEAFMSNSSTYLTSHVSRILNKN